MRRSRDTSHPPPKPTPIWPRWGFPTGTGSRTAAGPGPRRWTTCARGTAALYPERHRLTIAEPIEGTWDLAQRLAENGHALYAITNWSAESWQDALETHPRLADRFHDIVVSGREKMLKPDPAIYRLLIDRNGLAAADCLFIDDSAANVEGARAVGMDAVLFTDPAALERDLNDRWLL